MNEGWCQPPGGAQPFPAGVNLTGWVHQFTEICV
jgi:hypothetical protein